MISLEKKISLQKSKKARFNVCNKMKVYLNGCNTEYYKYDYIFNLCNKAKKLFLLSICK